MNIIARDKNNLVAWYITLIGFLGIFSTTISKNPVLPLFVNGLGGSDAILGIIAAASPLAGIIFSFPVGFLADKIGKRKLLIISGIIFTISPLLYLMVSSPLYLIPIRFFHGMATAIMGPVASAIIISFFDKNKGEKLGLYSSATLFGRTLAPLLGGFLIGFFAGYGGLFNYKIVYLSAFVLSLPIIVLSLLIPKEPGTDSIVRVFSFKEMISALRRFLKSGLVTATATIDMATYFIYGVLEAYLPLLLIQKKVSAGQIGLLFSIQVVSIALTKPFFGRLADRIDKRLQILGGIFILTVTTLLIPLLTDYYAIIVDILFFGLGMSLSTVATSTYLAENVAKTELATSMGILSAIMDVGQSAGPFLTGFIVTLYSYHVGFYFSGGVALLSAIFFYFQAYRINIRNVPR
jgi:MFS family permease